MESPPSPASSASPHAPSGTTTAKACCRSPSGAPTASARTGRELAEVLGEPDADLARQEAAIRERRERLRSLLDEAGRGRLSLAEPVTAVGFLGKRREVTKVRLHADEPERLCEALRETLAARTTGPSHAGAN